MWIQSVGCRLTQMFIFSPTKQPVLNENNNNKNTVSYTIFGNI